MTKTAKRISKINPSDIRKVFALAGKIKNPLDLSIGQPDFDVPKIVKEAAIKSIEEGFNHYTPTNGILELREKIAKKLAQKNAIFVHPNDVLITAGTSGAVFLLFSVLLDPGDEVIILDPYFIMYRELANFFDAKPKAVSTYPNFQPNIEEIKKAINSKTKLIVLNSPNNPTGAVYPEKTIRKIVQIARENNLLILSDEVYEDFIYEGRHFSPGSIYDKVITLGGFSKSCSMTGWRIGYAAGPTELIDQMAKLQQFTFVCAPSFAQKAALVAIEYNNQKEINDYKKKRDIIYNGLKNYYQIVKPQGAFYCFLKAPMAEDKFIKKLLEKKVIVVPGRGFSEQSGYVRISFAAPDNILKKAVKIFQKLG